LASRGTSGVGAGDDSAGAVAGATSLLTTSMFCSGGAITPRAGGKPLLFSSWPGLLPLLRLLGGEIDLVSLPGDLLLRLRVLLLLRQGPIVRGLRLR
jgi:hypothetical protein